MSHSSGIPVGRDLEQAFGAARTDASIRYLVAEIRDEKVVQVNKGQPTGNLKGDVDHVRSLLQPAKPCYVLLKLETKNDGGFEWMLISYVPDGSPVKERMLYASTRDTVKKSLGSSCFTEDLFASSPGDVTYDACQEAVSKKHYEGPLTQTEIITRMEKSAVIETGTTKEYVHSVAFPLSDEGKAALEKFSKSQLKLVQLKVDTTKETLELATAKAEVTVGSLGSEISASEPRFTFFFYPHSFNDETFNSACMILTLSLSFILLKIPQCSSILALMKHQ
eukprot:TRINITY_DN521_c0_g1_i1.p1 TRINITY_DN521_c0_g1~~TRINITY_DN521_c0_g1_i1.p1  ORF type:complete len:279 (-),score=54.64 TRINITY_DN521_c0_g1_i1:308-1144(-)